MYKYIHTYMFIYIGLKNIIESQLKELKLSGTYKTERIITSPQRVEIQSNGQNVINFCANNYLGLADNQELIEAAKRTLDTHGFGLASVRFICGT